MGNILEGPVRANSHLCQYSRCALHSEHSNPDFTNNLLAIWWNTLTHAKFFIINCRYRVSTFDRRSRVCYTLAMQKNIVITGASRGIGFELCRLAVTDGHRVLAVARTTSKSIELSKLKEQFTTRLEIVDFDLFESTNFEKIVKKIEAWNSLDILINNAGVLIDAIDQESLVQAFQVNSIAPLLLTKALLSKLKPSKSPRVINITSKMGSISDNSSGGYYGYRASKAALNMFNKSLSIDHPWLTTLVIHPGWVKTAMGGKDAPLSPQNSAKGIWKIASDTSDKLKSGSFMDYQSEPIPW